MSAQVKQSGLACAEPCPARPQTFARMKRPSRVAPPALILVGCSARKLTHAAPARDLYTSQLFRMGRAYCEARGDEWAILSALHGLVLPGQVLEPYDVSPIRLRSSSARALGDWNAMAALQLDTMFPGARVVLLAGSDYRGAIAHLPASRREEPLAGLGIGDRQGWLKRQTLHLREQRFSS